MSIFGINAIADKAVRDAIIQLQHQSGGGSGNVTVQADDPSNDQPGVEGDIIYASDTDSIWVFVETEWERAVGGNATFIQVRAYVPEDNSNYSDWIETSSLFRNDAGDAIALVATVIQNGEAFTNAQHEDFSYIWTKNGSQSFVNSDIQNANTGTTRRAVIINAGDVDNRGSAAFVCSVDY